MFAVALLTATISASARNVILRLNDNYDVSIDGRYYQGNTTISDLDQGRHRVNVYKVSGGFLGIGKKRSLVSTSNFNLRNNDVVIDVNRNGEVRINKGNNYNSQDRRYDRTPDRRYDRDEDRRYGRTDRENDREYRPYHDRGRGNKYGHNKDKKDKKYKSQKAYKNKDRDDDDDDDDDDD